jgi:predicted permease
MSWLKKFAGKPKGRGSEGNLADELRFHLEKEIELNKARGVAEAEARRQALIRFGGWQQTRENVRQTRWTHLLEIFLQDLRYGGRMLRKNPGVTIIAVLTLAMGIGMNTAIFSMLDSVLFRALPGKHPEELVMLRWHAAHGPKLHNDMSYGDCIQRQTQDCTLSLPFLNLLRAQSNVFSGLAGFAGAPQLAISGKGSATVTNRGQLVSGDYFSTIGIKAAAGRTLLPADDDAHAPPVVMLSYGYWRDDLAGAPDVVGQTIRLNSHPFTVIGVAEPGFRGLTPGHTVDLWLPLSARPMVEPRWNAEDNDAGSWWIVIVGRPKPGISLKQAEAAVSLLFRDQTLHEQKPLFAAADAPEIQLLPAQEGLSGGTREVLPPLYILMMAVGLVLLIACANIAGILLARAAGRSREIAVRLTLGARRGRLISQLLIESLLLSVVGGALGLLVGHWSTRALMILATGPREGPPPFTPELDARVLAFTAVIAILTGLIFGLAPALRSLRVDLTPALKSGGVGSETAPQTRWYSPSSLLVVFQVSLAIVALVTAGLLVRSLRNLKSVDLGFDSSNLLVFGLDPTLAGYKGQQVDALFRDLQPQIAALPGVTAVTYSWAALLSGWEWDTGLHAPGTPENEVTNIAYMPVGPHFFESMRIPLKTGRDFSSPDFAAAAARAALPSGAKPDSKRPPIAVIVNEAFVHRFFPQRNPLGQHLEESIEDPNEPRGSGWEIIGVAGDARYESLRGEVKPTMYAASAGSAFFAVRTAGDPMAMVPAIRDLIRHKDSNLPMYRIATQVQKIDERLFVESLVARLSTFLGLLALVLACTGIYGLLAYEVTRRTREIGIRMAVGAQRSDVVGMVVRQGLLLALTGALIGGVASIAVKDLLQSLLYKVRLGDPVTLAAVVGLLLLVALAACYVPAHRATRVDPLVALRYE